MLESGPMRFLVAQAVLLGLFTAPSWAQSQTGTPDTPFQPKRDRQFTIDGMFRQEWTNDQFVAADQFLNTNRWRLRLMPKVEAGGDRFTIAVSGDFNYSKDKNTEEPAPVTIVRDNYKSRDARVDLAFVRLQPVKWLHIHGGRFPMPLPFTEMVWDRDLRPQGGAATLEFTDIGDIERIAFTALGAQGSHVFEDEDVRMAVFTGEARLKAGPESRLAMAGSIIEYTRLGDLAPIITRQNTKTAAGLTQEYRIIDLVVRLTSGGNIFPLQLVGNMCWNTRVQEQKRGIWVAAILGSLTVSRARGDYTYARVDKDATVAAYAADDFFWGTGWEGHRAELSSRISDRLTGHVIGQIQRFKDSPREAEREHWVKRLRLEVRLIP